MFQDKNNNTKTPLLPLKKGHKLTCNIENKEEAKSRRYSDSAASSQSVVNRDVLPPVRKRRVSSDNIAIDATPSAVNGNSRERSSTRRRKSAFCQIKEEVCDYREFPEEAKAIKEGRPNRKDAKSEVTHISEKALLQRETEEKHKLRRSFPNTSFKKHELGKQISNIRPGCLSDINSKQLLYSNDKASSQLAKRRSNSDPNIDITISDVTGTLKNSNSSPTFNNKPILRRSYSAMNPSLSIPIDELMINQTMEARNGRSSCKNAEPIDDSVIYTVTSNKRATSIYNTGSYINSLGSARNSPGTPRYSPGTPGIYPTTPGFYPTTPGIHPYSPRINNGPATTNYGPVISYPGPFRTKPCTPRYGQCLDKKLQDEIRAAELLAAEESSGYCSDDEEGYPVDQKCYIKMKKTLINGIMKKNTNSLKKKKSVSFSKTVKKIYVFC